MYQRKDKRFTWDLFFKCAFILVLILVGGMYFILSTTLLNAKKDFNLFFNGFEVESSLMEEQYINYTLIDQRAQNFEQLIGKYHIPFNMTGEGWDYYPPVSIGWDYTNAKFYNNSQLLDTFDPLDDASPYNDINNLTYAGDRAHTALYEGVYCMGEAFRYAWAKRNNNEGNMTAARERIWKIIKAYELLSEVSEDSAFVRYAVPDTELAKEKFPGHWDTEDHYVVDYKGHKWSLSRHLSRDVSIGIMLGLSMSYYFVDDDNIRDLAGSIIEKSVEYWYDSNWRIIDTDGTQHTSGDFISARPMMEGSIVLTFLQMAKMVNPDKWGPIYNHYLYDKGFIHTIGRSMRMGIDLSPKIFDGYYGCNFVYNNVPTLILLEEDQDLRELYIQNLLNVIHDFTKLHRNANFDVVWLLCHAAQKDDKYDTPEIELKDYDLEIWKDANIKKPEDKEYIQEFCVRDIKDCLMRYAVRRYPNRNYWFSTTPGTFPNVHQQKIPSAKYPEYDYWEVDSDTAVLITSILGLAGRSIEDDGILNNSLPCDMRKAEDIMWQRRSFTVKTTERTTDTPGNFQVPAGPEYLSVYWIAKYLELF